MNKEIHQLVQELLPLYNEVDEESKKIIDYHFEECEECKSNFTLINSNFTLDNHSIDENHSDDIKPFKSLHYFKISMFLVLIVARLVIIGILINIWVSSSEYSTTMMVANVITYYFPFVGIVNSIIFMFYRKKLFWIVLIFDIIVLMFLDDIVSLFFN